MKRYIDKDGNFWDGASIVLDGNRIFNPSAEQLAEAGYTEYVEPEPTPEQLLQQAKDGKIQELMDYNQSEEVNSFTLGGQTMWLNFDERSRLQKAVDAKEALGRATMTKDWGGVEYTFTIQQWKRMLATLEDYAYDCQNATDRHKAAIDRLQTVQQVEEYDFTTDYPDKPVF